MNSNGQKEREEVVNNCLFTEVRSSVNCKETSITSLNDHKIRK